MPPMRKAQWTKPPLPKYKTVSSSSYLLEFDAHIIMPVTIERNPTARNTVSRILMFSVYAI
jgi:hypothetical protein